MPKKSLMFTLVLAFVLMISTIFTPWSVAAKEKTPIMVTLKNTEGQTAGRATLKETKKGVQVHLHAEGLTPGVHGIHFHEKGVCKPPKFDSAGGHFNPYNKEHGLKNPKGPHAGDLKNVFADSNGKINIAFTTDRVTLKKGAENSLLDDDGSALVIHEGADDQKTNPSGDSGARVLCGTIK